MKADLVIRNGILVDGSGSPAFRADVAIIGTRIVAVGDDVLQGRHELNADGLIVTPGFVDPHTHYDGQATWDPLLAPSAYHGVTTVAMGNCGVGFAPVEPDRHDWLVEMMEGVEDIPGSALHAGLRWDWQTFPEYLSALDRQPRVMDVGTHLAHAALRGFVMGDRGANPAEHPSAVELEAMAGLLAQALDVGAIGISTSRTANHRTSHGENLGTLRAQRPELLALASVLKSKNAGVFQFLSDAYRTNDDEFLRSEFELVTDFARASQRPMSYTVQQDRAAPERWRDLLQLAINLQDEGLDVKAQVAPRPIGVLLGLEASANIFTPSRAYGRIAELPLSERIAALNDPVRRSRILEEHALLTTDPDTFPGLAFFGRFDEMYLLDDPVNYDLNKSRSIAAIAKQCGMEPREYAYEIQIGGGGRQLVYVPLFNFVSKNLDSVHEMITSPVALFGLSDAGAHCGQICDGSMTTSYLSIWARDRKGQSNITLESVVHQISRRPAIHLGWLDRGLVAPGYLADLNIIDLGSLECRPPEVVADLPAGGRRLLQTATGYRWTVKRGTVTFENGIHTGELPGYLVRGSRPQPH